MKEQKKKIWLFLEEYFSQYGFKRRKQNNYIRTTDGNVIQDIGFTTATRGQKHVVYLNPVVGIIYRDVDKLMLQLRDGVNPNIKDYGPMICRPIGYLMPEHYFKEWKFTKDKDIREDAEDMAKAIIEYGSSYLEELSDVDQMIYGLATSKYSYIGSEVRDYILPVLYYLYGNSEQALLTVENAVTRRSNSINIEEYKALQAIYGEDAIQIPPNKALDSYMPFVEKFRKFLAEK